MITIIEDNKLTLKCALTKQQLVDLDKTFRIPNPEMASRIRLGLRTYGIPQYIKTYKQTLDGIEFFSGDKRKLLNFLTKFVRPDEINMIRDKTYGEIIHPDKWNDKFILRNYQIEAVNAGVNSDGCIIVPAGGGKTIIGSCIIHNMRVKTLWITHTTDLMNQSAERFKATFNANVSFIGAGTIDLSGDIIIATVQTLTKRPEIVEELNKTIGLVIVDEAHHTPSTCFSNIIHQLKAYRKIGVTATPDRKDGLEQLMYASIGENIFEIHRQTLYDEGFLIVPELIPIYTDFDTSTAFNGENAVDMGGDAANWHGVVECLVLDADRKNLIVDTILDNYENEKSLVLSEWVSYGTDIMNELLTKNPNVKAEFIHGGIKKKDRIDILRRFENNEIDVLFATKVAREGLDLPNLTQLFLTTPKKGDTSRHSRDGSALEQEIGRIMRPDPKNASKKSRVFDFVDHKHGILKSQWYSRRKVYNRLSIVIPKKERQKTGNYINSLFPDLEV